MRKSILENIHETAKDLYEIGLIDATTMRKFDFHCLEPTKKLSADEVKRIRLKTRASQPVFAKFLNVSPSAVKQWETGERQPSGASLRLLQLIDHAGLAMFKPIQKVEQIKTSTIAGRRSSKNAHE